MHAKCSALQDGDQLVSRISTKPSIRLQWIAGIYHMKLYSSQRVMGNYEIEDWDVKLWYFADGNAYCITQSQCNSSQSMTCCVSTDFLSSKQRRMNELKTILIFCYMSVTFHSKVRDGSWDGCQLFRNFFNYFTIGNIIELMLIWLIVLW